MFTEKLKQFLADAGFWKTFGIKFIWNFSGRKLLILLLAVMFFLFGKLDQWALMTAFGIFAGAAAIEKFRGE
jgi:ABC-type amino acid transport system permease subunit